MSMKILLIEDNPADAEYIRELLLDQTEPSFEIAHEESLSRGAHRLEEGGIDLILLDLGLPDSQGIDSIRAMQARSGSVPVVVLTGLDDEETGIRALQEGAQDYLIKGELSSPLLVRSIRYAIERHRVEMALRESEETARRRAEDLQRSNEDLERFAYAVSHDLQEPVRMITSYAQLLARRYKGKLDADADEFIGFIEQGSRRMHDLIADLLEYSRVSTRQQPLVPIDTEAVLAATLENLRFALEEQGGTVTHDPLLAVLGNPTQLQQVFQNLIGNGIKFRREGVAPRIHVAAERTGGMVRFSVADNGIGIEPQYFERIFVIFQRLHGREQYEGTGIGLAIVRRIVERHGGRIWVESRVGEGTAFHFTLQPSHAR